MFLLLHCDPVHTSSMLSEINYFFITWPRFKSRLERGVSAADERELVSVV